ncbi:anthranilate synthase component II [Piscibacillus halophilus]|nr:aminodeoxychorismate/anthranilate synthase component II [Piscibacillus halophilus]
MIDHEDSFTYNLVHILEEIGEEVLTIEQTEVSIENMKKLNPRAVILSPGPGHPKDQTFSKRALHSLKGQVPILGVCLGFQIIVEYFGGTIREASRPMHGLTDHVLHDGETIYSQLESPVQVTRYHSLIADAKSFPRELTITGSTSQGEIMSCRHNQYPIEGVQFHPEAILTKHGKQLLQNFLNIYSRSGVCD